jgi:hypothetical protein
MAPRRWAVAACVTVVVALVAITAGCGGTRSGGDKAAASGGLPGAASGAATGRARVVKFAECMRRNGVSAFPDPDATGALTIDAVANGSSVDTNSATFRHALSRCKDSRAVGVHGTTTILIGAVAGSCLLSGHRGCRPPSHYEPCRPGKTLRFVQLPLLVKDVGGEGVDS